VRDLNFPALLAFGAAIGLAAAKGGAPDDGPRAPDSTSVILAAKPAAPSSQPLPSPPTQVSAAISAEISSGMPGYTLATASSSPNPDKAAADKPLNDIPRLPVEMLRKYEVRENRMPVFRPRDLYTNEGLTELSFKEHPGYRIGNIFNLNAPAAHNRIIGEQLFAARIDLVDTAFAMATGGDTREIEAMRQDVIEDGFNQDSPVGR
jgi:hypothetical protein